jgi:hypothetical protein
MSQRFSPSSNPGPEQPRHGAEAVSVQVSDPASADNIVGRIQQELHSLLLERVEILKRIGVIRRTLNGLADIFGSDLVNGQLQDSLLKPGRHSSQCRPGLTETCRRILIELANPLTTDQLCDRIREENPPEWARHKNPTSSVLAVLKRLVSYGEVNCVRDREGRTWLWVAAQQQEEVAVLDDRTAPFRSGSKHYDFVSAGKAPRIEPVRRLARK